MIDTNSLRWIIRLHMWHFQVEIGSLWDCAYKTWTNVTVFLLETHIQLESVTYIYVVDKNIYFQSLAEHMWVQFWTFLTHLLTKSKYFDTLLHSSIDHRNYFLMGISSQYLKYSYRLTLNLGNSIQFFIMTVYLFESSNKACPFLQI